MDPVRDLPVPIREAEVSEEDRTRRALLHMLEDLRREHELLRRARHDWLGTVDAIADPMMVHDCELRVVRCNRAYAAQAGMTFADILGRPYWECFPKRSGPLEACLLQIESGSSGVHETELHLATGEIFISRAYSVRGGTESHVLHLFENATEKRRVHEALLESERRLALATQSAGIGIWDWDIPANKLVWDKRMYELYGIREQDFSGAYDAWRSGLHPEDRERGDAAIAAALKGGHEFHLEFRVLWPGGEVRYIEAHSVVQRAGDGTATRMIGVNWDVTERKLAAQKQDFTNAILTTQQETSLDAIYVVDSKQKMISCNRRFVEMWGVPDDIMQSRSDQRALESVLAKFESPEEFLDSVRLLYANRDLKQRDELHLKDGRTLDRYSSPMVGADGKYYGRVFYFRDVTEQRTADDRLRAQIEELQRWQGMNLDREDRVIELKREINELLAAQHQPPRYESAQ